MKHNPYEFEKHALYSIYPDKFYSSVGWLPQNKKVHKASGGLSAEEILKNCGHYYKDGYNYLIQLPQEKMPEDVLKEYPVIYKFNEDWLRCDNFSKIHEGRHILFAGCSETEGAGGNIEDIWTHRLYTKLSERNKMSGFYSVAKSGASMFQIIANVRLYVQKFGKPDHLFVLLPNVLRFFQWDTEYNSWNTTHRVPGYTRNQNQLIKKDDPQDFEMHNELFPYWLYSWDLFVSFCKLMEIKVTWAIWHLQEQGNILKLKELGAFEGSNFIYLEGVNEDVIQKYRPSLELGKHDISRRDGHQGNIFHEYITDKFLEAIKDYEDLV